MWILFALLAPALYGVAEIFDEYLSNRGFKHITSLIFFASILNFLFIPILFLIQKPAIPPLNLWWALIGVGLTNLLYLYPYYKSLQIEDTSIVSAFFSLGKIIIPLFAFFFIGELLSLREYAGIGIIIIGNIILALHVTKKKLRLSRAFYLILLASTILAVDGILYKYMFDHGINWSTAIAGQLFVSGFLGIVVLLSIRKTRRHIVEEKANYFKSGKIFFIEELFTFLAVAAEMYAITLAPVSLVKGLGMSIPIFILSYTVMVKRFNPKAFHESTGRAKILRKVCIFSLIILGLWLIGFGE